jgi:predicted Rossmann fold nucleotide-binding protein DprA/Smf involved in DNA uptake
MQTQTILRALEFTAARGGFTSTQQKKAAAALIKSMRSKKSVSGRHQQLAAMLKKGATIDDMIKATGSSRRTIFRYLNQFEQAGLSVQLGGGEYKLK